MRISLQHGPIMKALLSFTAAVNDTLRLRLLALASAHKVSTLELAGVLKQSTSVIAAQVKLLVEAELLKSDDKAEVVRVKGKHADLLSALFSEFKATSKKDSTLQADAKALKSLRSVKKTAPKTKSKKAKAEKPKATKKEAAKSKPAKEDKAKVKPTKAAKAEKPKSKPTKTKSKTK